MAATPDDYAKFRERHFSAEYLKDWKVKEKQPRCYDPELPRPVKAVH
jgi:hypothetical protein